MIKDNFSPEEKRHLYIELLKIAKASENDAIKIPMAAMVVAPPEDLAQLAEILNDENDHDAIYTDLLFKALTGNPNGADNTTLYAVDEGQTKETEDGGEGSGNFDHLGRPGKHGGSRVPQSKKKKKGDS